jgi:hypothetical protein
MTSHSRGPYRGYRIEIDVTSETSSVLGGSAHWHQLRWRVLESTGPQEEVVSFAEQYSFISAADALAYGEARAQAFIDCMESQSSSGTDEAHRLEGVERPTKA